MWNCIWNALLFFHDGAFEVRSVRMKFSITNICTAEKTLRSRKINALSVMILFPCDIDFKGRCPKEATQFHHHCLLQRKTIFWDDYFTFSQSWSETTLIQRASGDHVVRTYGRGKRTLLLDLAHCFKNERCVELLSERERSKTIRQMFCLRVIPIIPP